MISAERANSKLFELCSPEITPPSSERFLVEAKDYSELFDSNERPLRPIAQKWRMSFGQFDPSVISFAIKLWPNTALYPRRHLEAAGNSESGRSVGRIFTVLPGA